jgi:hypothetical protein
MSLRIPTLSLLLLVALIVSGDAQQTSVASLVSQTVSNQGRFGTCYAHAAATSIRAAEKLIRTPEDKSQMLARIVRRFGIDGGDSEEVLKVECPRKGLKYHWVNQQGVVNAINHNLPVLTSFAMTKKGWNAFFEFFQKFPKGVWTTMPDMRGPIDGAHAVQIVGKTPRHWKLKNSWGDNWGDNGYFRISKDVYDGIVRKFAKGPKYIVVTPK